MLKEGIDVHMPLVDDNAIDAVTRRGDGSFVGVQIKTRSKRHDPVCGDRSQAAGQLFFPADVVGKAETPFTPAVNMERESGKTTFTKMIATLRR